MQCRSAAALQVFVSVRPDMLQGGFAARMLVEFEARHAVCVDATPREKSAIELYDLKPFIKRRGELAQHWIVTP